MESRIRERYNDSILAQACQRYGILPGKIRLLDGFESFMYEFERPDGEYILRIGHTFHRSVNLICGEVDWLNHLSRGGAGVARAVLSPGGSLVEQIPDGQGEFFLATAFVKAPGHAPGQADHTPRLYERWGEAVGRMHALTQTYQPANPAWTRPNWDDPLNLVGQYLPAEAVKLQDNYQRVIDHLRSLPRDGRSWGLVHQDAHAGNFFVDERGEITLFDFDDCVYSWFIYDIAMVLFYEVMSDMPRRTPEFFIPFLRGYRRENVLDPVWLQEIPYFLKLREIELVAIIERSFGGNITDPWARRFMEGRVERIEAGLPYNPLDFTQFAVCLTAADD